MAIIFWKVQVVATNVVWQYQYDHYLYSYSYLYDVVSNVELFLQIAPFLHLHMSFISKSEIFKIDSLIWAHTPIASRPNAQ